MATLTALAMAAKPGRAPDHGNCTLTLSIDGIDYRLLPIARHETNTVAHEAASASRGVEAPVELDSVGIDPEEATLPRLTLIAWIQGEAARYQALGTDAASLVEEMLTALARRMERVGASTVAEYHDRWAALDAPPT